MKLFEITYTTEWENPNSEFIYYVLATKKGEPENEEVKALTYVEDKDNGNQRYYKDDEKSIEKGNAFLLEHGIISPNFDYIHIFLTDLESDIDEDWIIHKVEHQNTGDHVKVIQFYNSNTNK